jgi:redox-sensitive bicupin YhaK (pirin superfamily)
LGEKLKPFIFLDFFSAEITPGFGFPMHPHSGIATLTWQPGCDVQYQDTTGQRGLLKAGGLEWMNSGGGAWHQGTLMGQGHATGFQLWVPMPPGIEDGPSAGQYVAPQDVAWAFAFEGGPMVQGERTRRELLTFEQDAGDIEIAAGDENVRVLVGTARRHEHPLVLGPSSVHTSRESLARGLDRIREIGAGVRAAASSR